MTIDDAMPWNAVSDDDYDCPTYRKFGHCACSTGVLGSACPNQYVGDGEIFKDWDEDDDLVCEHLSSSGIDQNEGPDKIWRCHACGWLHTCVTGDDGLTVSLGLDN